MLTSYPKWRDALIEAIDPRFHNAEWLDELAEKSIILETENSVLMLWIVVYPTGWRELKGISAGKPQEIVELIRASENVAKQMECGTMKIESRHAWVKLAAPLGFYVYQHVLEKDL